MHVDQPRSNRRANSRQAISRWSGTKLTAPVANRTATRVNIYTREHICATQNTTQNRPRTKHLSGPLLALAAQGSSGWDAGPGSTSALDEGLARGLPASGISRVICITPWPSTPPVYRVLPAACGRFGGGGPEAQPHVSSLRELAGPGKSPSTLLRMDTDRQKNQRAHTRANKTPHIKKKDNSLARVVLGTVHAHTFPEKKKLCSLT